MKFIDMVELTVQGGTGGDGAVAFLRQLYVPKGGPAGGDGGRGGDVIFFATTSQNTLLELKDRPIITGANGGRGQPKNMHGRNAPATRVAVPVGTTIYHTGTDQVLCDLVVAGQEYVVAAGGQGGRGNARFANSRNKAPTIFEKGDRGITIPIRCELRSLADIGLVGCPNAGKSTLLAAVSASRPQIGATLLRH